MIAFCTTCKGREQHLKLTLPKNLADNADYLDCKFVLLDYGASPELFDYIDRHHRMDIASGRLEYFRFRTFSAFHMAHAKNMAHRCGMLSGADILVNLDADNYTGPEFAWYLDEQFKERNIFMWTRMMPSDGSPRPRGVSGRIACRAQDFLKVGGYDEKYDTWGPDDKDFNTRLRRLGLQPREIDQRFAQVILHNDKMRFREYRHARNGCDSSDVKVDPCCTVANAGIFGCGHVWGHGGLPMRLTGPFDLDPLPTRIFGIGMHKTATTSLHHALETLGYDSAHWKSAHWAKAIWREMNSLGCSPTLERSYAICDFPIARLYEQLDRAYPGSKFILTVRDANRWIEAVESHWDPNYNPFRAGWDSDPFTHRMHEIVYGRRDFDRATMLARYHRHNYEVLRYFRNRSSDLLVMDMDAGAGWRELCDFLGNPRPAVPYPRSFETVRQIE